MTSYEITQRILQEVDEVLQRVQEKQVARFREAIRQTRRIFLFGAGREGLVMRSFAMRLMHLGLDVGVVGDMSTGPITSHDLFIVSAGPGVLETAAALIARAHRAGGRVAMITAQPAAELPQKADLLLVIPGQTMAEGTASTSVQPMGSVFEQAMWILFDALVVQLKDDLGETYESMAARHTNLE